MTHPPTTVDAVAIPAPFPGEPGYGDFEDNDEPPAEEVAAAFLLGDLRHLTHRVAYLEGLRSEFIRDLRRFGVPWADIATALHISRQAAWKTYRHLDTK